MFALRDTVETARRAWAAYVSPDPRELNEVVRAKSDLPFLREGLQLHAARFPSTRNGLGAIENRLLRLISAGATDFAILFPMLDASPPRYGFGDSQVLQALRSMATRKNPLITMAEVREDTPPKATFGITAAGEEVLAGSADDITLNEPDYWLGGVHITKDNVWRWDENRGEIVSSRPAGS